MFHPRCYGELVCQVLGHHVMWDISSLMSVESVDEVAVAAAVCQQRCRPVCGGAGARKEVSAARRGTWMSQSHDATLSRAGTQYQAAQNPVLWSFIFPMGYH